MARRQKADSQPCRTLQPFILMVRLGRATTSDRFKAIALFCVCVPSILAALFLASRDLHEETRMLERFARQFEGVQRVDMATERYLRGLISAARRPQARDAELQRRRLLAISWIEAVLDAQDSAVGALGRTGPDHGGR